MAPTTIGQPLLAVAMWTTDGVTVAWRPTVPAARPGIKVGAAMVLPVYPPTPAGAQEGAEPAVSADDRLYLYQSGAADLWQSGGSE